MNADKANLCVIRVHPCQSAANAWFSQPLPRIIGRMAEALRFECQPGCTECCRQKGFVYLSEPDILRAAAYLHLTPAALERKYVYRTSRRARLRVPAEANCHFLFEGGCSIHEA